jgi:hypothetical protein
MATALVGNVRGHFGRPQRCCLGRLLSPAFFCLRARSSAAQSCQAMLAGAVSFAVEVLVVALGFWLWALVAYHHVVLTRRRQAGMPHRSLMSVRVPAWLKMAVGDLYHGIVDTCNWLADVSSDSGAARANSTANHRIWDGRVRVRRMLGGLRVQHTSARDAKAALARLN